MLVLEPASIHAADICRDGGTYVLVYLDTSGVQHEVEVLVRQDENYDVIGYWPPSVKNYVAGETCTLTWEEAANLGRRLAVLIEETIGWGGPDRARQAVEILGLQGRLPTRR